MKNVLVAYASRMGSTREIAATIGEELSGRGFRVDLRSASSARDASEYDAVVLGSALYLGRWDKSAVDYLRRQGSALAVRPTWLFQSGPCGPDADTQQTDTPHAVARLCQKIGVASPVTFGGNLDHSKARGWLARWVSTGDQAGDARDWKQIQAWADVVGTQLEASPTVPVA